jgi:hypothetical protein
MSQSITFPSFLPDTINSLSMKTDLIGTVPRLFLEIDWPLLVQSKISPFNPAPTTNFPFL